MTLQNLQAEFVDLLNTETTASDSISPMQHLQIYRHNILSNLIKTLKNTYPLTEKLLGNDFFQETAQTYAQHYPSRHSNLNDYGEYFSDFLGEYEPVSSLFYLSEVAKFEWICHELSTAPDVSGFNMEALSQIPKVHYTQLQLVLNPALRLHQFHYPILAIIDLCEGRIDEIKELHDVGVHLLILRQTEKIILLPLSAGEAAFLQAILRGKVLASALECALQAESDFKLEEKLSIWIENKTIIDCYSE